MKITNLINTPSVFRLEKHLDDYRKRKDYLSGDVRREINRDSVAVADSLSRENATATKNYLAYQSALSYTKRARFVRALQVSAANPITDKNKIPE